MYVQGKSEESNNALEVCEITVAQIIKCIVRSPENDNNATSTPQGEEVLKINEVLKKLKVNTGLPSFRHNTLPLVFRRLVLSSCPLDNINGSLCLICLLIVSCYKIQKSKGWMRNAQRCVDVIRFPSKSLRYHTQVNSVVG